MTSRHAIYIDGFLIPAINLVNGITIIPNAKSKLSTFTYDHIEFETHEVIKAEGLTVESYLHQDGVDFDNEDEYLTLYGPRANSVVRWRRAATCISLTQHTGLHLRNA